MRGLIVLVAFLTLGVGFWENRTDPLTPQERSEYAVLHSIPRSLISNSQLKRLFELQEKDLKDLRRVENLRARLNENFNLVTGPRAHMVSSLAYAAGEASSDFVAQVVVRDEIQRMIRVFGGWQRELPRGNGYSRSAIGYEKSIEFLKGLKIIAATRDCVCVYFDKALHESAYFGFRGTSKLRDMVPDAQIATNAAKMPRMLEAIQFARTWMRHDKIKRLQKQMVYFMGHSLGGFIAEGVRNRFVGTQAITIQPGAPVAFFDEKPVVRAWGKYNKEWEERYDRIHAVLAARITRVVVYGDLVSGNGVLNGRANIYRFGRASTWNALKNHKLDSIKRFFAPEVYTPYKMTRHWSDAAEHLLKSTERELQDDTIMKRLKQSKERAKQQILKFVDEGASSETASRTQKAVSEIYNKATSWFRKIAN